MLVLNLFGAPGAGKSTLAAGLTHLFRRDYIEAEWAMEYAKDAILSDTSALLADQLLVFAQQHHRLWRLADKGVEIAICDSPLPLSAVYAPEGYPAEFTALVKKMFFNYHNINFFVNRNHPYSPVGRVHSESEATQAGDTMKTLLEDWGVGYTPVVASSTLAKEIHASIKAAHPELWRRMAEIQKGEARVV